MQPLGSLREAQGGTQAVVCEGVQNPNFDGNYHRRVFSYCASVVIYVMLSVGIHLSGSLVEL